MSGRRGVLTVFISVAMAFGLTACGDDEEASSSSSEQGIPKGDIVIGAAIAKTGFLAPYDEGIKTVRLRIEDINREGGIAGHKLKLIEADTRSDLQRGSVAGLDLVDKGAQVMLVTCETGAGAPAALVAGEKGIVSFTLCASEPAWNPPNFEGLAYSVFGSIASEAAAGAQFLQEDKKVENPFLLVDTSISYGKNACKAYEAYVKEQGGSIAGTAEFKNEDPSIKGQVAEIQSSGADGVALCSYPPGGATALKQMRAAGVDVPVWGPNAFDGTFWLESVPDLSNFYFTTGGSVFGDDPRPEVNEILADLLKRGAQDTTALPAYSTVEAITKAIKATDSVDGETLAAELDTWKDEPLLIGPTTYTDKIHVPDRSWYIVEIQNGKDRYLTTADPTFVPSLDAG